MFARLQRLASRLLGFIILPAQLPGDPIELVNDLVQAPWQTVRSWSPGAVWALVKQVVTNKKLEIPQDETLKRLRANRDKWCSGGWKPRTITTADGLRLDAVIKPPTDRADQPRYVLFVGGNSQKYEDWLPYFDLYARDSQMGFLCFNFRGVVSSEGAVTCLDDMLLDMRAAVDLLLVSGVLPHHILIHGFSIGAAISTCVASPPSRYAARARACTVAMSAAGTPPCGLVACPASIPVRRPLVGRTDGSPLHRTRPASRRLLDTRPASQPFRSPPSFAHCVGSLLRPLCGLIASPTVWAHDAPHPFDPTRAQDLPWPAWRTAMCPRLRSLVPLVLPRGVCAVPRTRRRHRQAAAARPSRLRGREP